MWVPRFLNYDLKKFVSSQFLHTNSNSKVKMEAFLFVFCAVVNLQELVNVLCYCFWYLCSDELIGAHHYFLLVFFISTMNCLKLIINFNCFFGFSNLVMQWHSAKKSWFWHYIVGNQSPTLTPCNATLLIIFVCLTSLV